MPDYCRMIRASLPGGDPYAGFQPGMGPLDISGGGDWAFVHAVLEKVRPKLVVEVGTWKGVTALRVADWMRSAGVDGAVICVDTWLGGLEHLEGTVSSDWRLDPYIKNGWPMLQSVFLDNVVRHGLEDWIVPLATTSTIGAKWVARRNLKPDIVLIDGSHDEEDVLQDLRAWWKCARPGGIIMGDDWCTSWPGVITAVNRFCAEKGIDVTAVGVSWMLERRPPPEFLEWMELCGGSAR